MNLGVATKAQIEAMRENNRSRGRWKPQQTHRQEKLQDLAYDESISEPEFRRLLRLNSLHNHYLNLQHPKVTRESKEFRNYLQKFFRAMASEFATAETSKKL